MSAPDDKPETIAQPREREDAARAVAALIAAENRFRAAPHGADSHDGLRSHVAQARDALRVAVRAWVLTLRDRGVTPEAALIEIKNSIQPESAVERHEYSRLVSDVITWSIEDYYLSAES